MHGTPLRHLRFALFLLPLALGGCAISWRAGAGLVATTQPAIGAEGFIGGNFGFLTSRTEAFEGGAKLDTSIQSGPLRGGIGFEESLAFRKESPDGNPGYRLGAEGGVRALFGNTTRGQALVDGLFDILPVVRHHGDEYSHVGVGLRAGIVTLIPSDADPKPPVYGHFEMQIFYEYCAIIQPFD